MNAALRNLVARRAILLLLLLLLTTGTGVAIGLVAGGDGAPGEPASFYGTAVNENGTEIPANETIVAVVGDKTADEMAVNPAGQYGGEGAFDDKLRVDSGSGDTVEFRLGDTNGPIGGSAALVAGVYETNLTFPADSLSYVNPDAKIDVDPAVVAPGQNITFSAGDSRTFDDSEIQSYVWSIERNGTAIGTIGGATATRSFDENGTYDIELEVTDSNDRTNTTNTTFEIEPEHAIEPTDTGDAGTTSGGMTSTGGGGSIGGTASGGGATTSSGSTENRTSENGSVAIGSFTPSSEPTLVETLRIDDADPDTHGTTATFNSTTIRKISFDESGVTGDVIVREFDSPTEDAPPLPAGLQVVSTAILTVPSEQRNSGATLRAVVAPERVQSKYILPNRLGVYRLQAGADEWESLPTETNEEEERLIVEAATPGFSQFVIAGPASPDRIDANQNPDSQSERRLSGAASSSTADETKTSNGDSGTKDDDGLLRPVAALFGLLVIVGTVGRIMVPRRRGR